ncbi:MAG: biopolymer transporter ExbD [Candidatus Eisenbacteria sp.]|nr:biopolymer transporter ExbD [Candidatus Eisenbacteria bacterium]
MRSSRRPMSEINVTPFVDVVLVLLIIFMLTAPFLQGGIGVKLPKASAQGVDLMDEIVITVTAEGAVYLNDDPVQWRDFDRSLRRLLPEGRGRVFLKADQAVAYGRVVQVISKIKALGIQDLGLVTQPEEEEEQ